MKRLLLIAVLAPALASAQPKKKIKDIVQPVRIEKMPAPADVAEQLQEAVRAHDVKATTKLLRSRFFTRGMWFPDAACTKRFSKERVIEKREVAAFATCLAKLEPQTSTRKSAAYDGAVFTYAPGVEVELGIQDGAIYYVGLLHAKAPRNVPSLTAQAFEALRTAGSTNVDGALASALDPILKRGRSSVAAWLEVCLDAQGKLTASVSEATTPEIGELLLTATADWKFNAFVHGKKPTPACTQTLVTYPASKAPKVEMLPNWEIPWLPDEGVEGGIAGGVAGEWTPGVGYTAVPPPPPPPPPSSSGGTPPSNIAPTLLEAQRIAGTKNIVPDDITKEEIARSGKDKVIGSFKLCVDVTGKVTQVTRLKATGFEAYDKKLLTEMRTNWAYKPYEVNGKAVPVCTAVTFIYSQAPYTPPPPRK